MNSVGSRVLYKAIRQGKIPIALPRLNRLPFIKAAKPSHTCSFEHWIEDGVGREPFGARRYTPRTSIVPRITGLLMGVVCRICRTWHAKNKGCENHRPTSHLA